MTILAAIDGTERAKQIVPLAYDLAKAFDELLIVLHVVPTEDYEAHKEDLESISEFEDFALSQEEESAACFARASSRRRKTRGTSKSRRWDGLETSRTKR